MTANPPTVDDALARLAVIRIEIERCHASVWCLDREADELRHMVRASQAKATVPQSAPKDAHAPS
jgi:hypothetical protein